MTEGVRSGLTRYTRLLVGATLILVAAGGMVTSTGSGLAVPDWPTTYGYSMFSFPLGKMVGGIFYEHGHRLIATTVGMLTIGLVIWLWRAEPRRWVRRLGIAALAVVILQGLLGGLTVLLFLPDAISISHAGLAQIFFCMTVALALVTSPTWRVPPRALVEDRALERRLLILVGLVYAQILIGATMRHTGAGLAIPDFPLAFGRLIPPAWTDQVAIHFAHRVGALVVTVAVLLIAAYIWRAHPDRPELVRPSWLLVVLVAMQVALGGLVILTGRQPVINTLHVATGAAVLGTSVVLTLRAFRHRFTKRPHHAPGLQFEVRRSKLQVSS
ncbi:MAG TPA: COX15/CtaA family protein [Vicinamibacterales bacterium]|nr:COX15/CtaA family protein [Vicinamibacterales bacterium]